MGALNWLQNSGIIGKRTASIFSGEKDYDGTYATPTGGDTIPSSVLTKAQKTFSSNAETPNFPKPKTLYFVYFHLNPALEKKIAYKQKLIQKISGESWEGISVNSINTSNATLKDTTEKEYEKAATEGLSEIGSKIVGSLTSKSTQTSKTEPLSDSSLVDYIPTKDVFKKLSYEMSKLVKAYDKPSVKFDTEELNEYNRTRIVYSGQKYNDVSITFYDVKNNPVQEFFNAYLKFISGDFLCKNFRVWEDPIDNNHWNNANGYIDVHGKKQSATYYSNLNSFGLNVESNFRLIDRISFCEYYMNRLMVYTIENPVLTEINWGNGAMGDFNYNDIKVTFKYEGITNDLIDIDPYNVGNWLGGSEKVGGMLQSLKNWLSDGNMTNGGSGNNIAYLRYMVNKEIRSDVATFLQTRYKTVANNVVSDITSILKGYMNGETKFSWNTLKNQALDTARKYGFANEANTFSQVQQMISNYNSKEDTTAKFKYIANMATDPTSLIGKMSSSTVSNNYGRGGNSSTNVILY